jgi:hypothetical protein
MEQTQPSPFSLDALIRLAKKVSLLTALVTGLGLVALYFFGIAIYATFLSAFGVPPFEFSLQHFGGRDCTRGSARRARRSQARRELGAVCRGGARHARQAGRSARLERW